MRPVKALTIGSIALLLSLALGEPAAGRDAAEPFGVEHVRRLYADGAFIPVSLNAPRLIADAKRSSHHARAAELLIYLAGAEQALGRIPRATVLLQDAVAQARAAKDTTCESGALCALAANLALTRRWAEAETALDESARLAEALRDEPLQASALVRRAWLHLSRGRSGRRKKRSRPRRPLPSRPATTRSARKPRQAPRTSRV